MEDPLNEILTFNLNKFCSFASFKETTPLNFESHSKDKVSSFQQAFTIQFVLQKCL